MNRQTQKVTALYSRLSRDDEAVGDSGSIVNQKAMLENYAAQNGFFNVAHFSDDGYSGKNFERPDWKRLVEEIEAGNVETVITKDMSRVGRDYLQTGYYTEVFFREKGVRFIAISNNIDSQNSESGEFAPFLNIMSEWYLRDTSRKIKAAKKTQGMSGKRLTTKPIYGYMLDPDDKSKWIIDPEAAEIVKRIFALAIEGNGTMMIANMLAADNIERPTYYHYTRGIVNAANYDHSDPYKWNSGTVAFILKKQEYLGHTVNFRSYKDSYKDMVKKFPDIERGESASVTGRRHVPTRVFKQAVNLSRHARKIDALLNDINPLNAGKRKEEIRTELNKFFPRMEKQEIMFRKYQKEFSFLEQENSNLEKKLESSKPSVMAQLEAGKQQQEIIFLRQFYASVPEEYKTAYRATQQKQLPKQER